MNEIRIKPKNHIIMLELKMLELEERIKKLEKENICNSIISSNKFTLTIDVGDNDAKN